MRSRGLPTSEHHPDDARGWRGRVATQPAWLIALVISLVLLAGALCLTMPFSGDQAAFTVYGRELTRGAVLYRDVFDIKQPGIFWFYSVGGWLFGFTEVGIHLFELAYWAAFSLFAAVALRPYFATRWAAPLVPVFTVVVYYLYAGLLDLTQVESVVAFPLLLAWWFLDRADARTRSDLRMYAAAGLSAATVMLFKHVYVLVVLAFLTHVVIRARREGVDTRDLRRSIGAFFVALVVPILGVIAYFAAYGQLGRLWWATFELGPAAQVTTERPLSYLTFGVRRFLIGYGPVVVLAVLGLAQTFRKRDRPRLNLVSGMTLWCAVGGTAFILQGWFEHKWVLFTVPLGILAVAGVESLVTQARKIDVGPRSLALGAAVILAILGFLVGAPAAKVQTRLLLSVVIGCGAAAASALITARRRLHRFGFHVLLASLGVSIGLLGIVPSEKIGQLARHDFALTTEARAGLRRTLSPFYEAADRDLVVIGADLPPGPLHVIGSSVLQLRADRPPADPFLALRPEFFDDEAWRELDAILRSDPSRFIVVDWYLSGVIEDRRPAIMELIRSRYEVAFVGASGTWYERRGAPGSAQRG